MKPLQRLDGVRTHVGDRLRGGIHWPSLRWIGSRVAPVQDRVHRVWNRTWDRTWDRLWARVWGRIK